MNDETIRTAVLDALVEVAPDIDAAEVDSAIPFRDQFDFDSVDYLNFVIALHERFSIDIPEQDYPRLNGVDAAVEYLRSHRSSE